MGVSPDPVAGKIGVCQKTALTIKRAAVAMETLRKKDHDVGKLLHLISYVAVWDLPEAKWCDSLPNFEGPPDGLVGLVLAHLRGVVLYAKTNKQKNTIHSTFTLTWSSIIVHCLLTYEKVMSFLCHFRAW